MALSASNGFIHPFFFSGGITISFPGMGLSGLSVQAKIEIWFVKRVSVSGFFFHVLLYSSVHKIWVLLLRGRYDVENQGLHVVLNSCVHVFVYMSLCLFICLSKTILLNVFQS